jgi:DNA-binding transcriptional MocR family regulator
VLSVERKKEIYAVCSKYDVIIVEDEPYWYLQFPSAATEEAKSRGQPAPPQQKPPYTPARSSGYPFLDSLTPSFLALDTDGRVVRLDTFSKTVAPGCRLGWITAQPAIAERFQRINEATTQQPSGFVQGLISELVLGPHHQQSQKQQEARSAFARLLTPSQKAAFTGWDMTGWVRWLEGLRGTYERRMARMCRILDQGSSLISSRSGSGSASQWTTVSRTPLFTYSWPRGGMFIWLAVNLPSHPLYLTPGSDPSSKIPVLNGPVLSTALMIFLTQKPFKVLAVTGSMFSADDKIREEEGWRYYRLCFAAEAEENIEKGAERFVQGVHAFWGVRDARVVERLLEDVNGQGGLEGMEVGEDVLSLGGGMGCGFRVLGRL